MIPDHSSATTEHLQRQNINISNRQAFPSGPYFAGGRGAFSITLTTCGKRDFKPTRSRCESNGPRFYLILIQGTMFSMLFML
jgi:hypothetical protein